ncbi:pro-FMRFamide-related neuropeptide FF [Mesoplodon densirostris]|uniref:pro-FMRFamide-related neuropeptide FF n=1 Tax=Mesoplodon densirostris TaxID=48708 RepID=UPI0028DC1333|nr:pro-FMRFamide-related neuropeptide FF [Mesoplodon densirostris]
MQSCDHWVAAVLQLQGAAPQAEVRQALDSIPPQAAVRGEEQGDSRCKRRVWPKEGRWQHGLQTGSSAAAVSKRRPGGRDEGDQSFTEEDSGARPPQDAQTPGALLRSLLQAMQRPSRSPAFLFQPQRSGRNTQGSWSNEGLSSPFWSLTAPRRFGKK